MIKRTEQFQDRLARLFPSDDPTKDSLAKNVTFQVTDGCNLACTYCYQISKHNHFMEFETAKKFIDMLLDEEEKNEYVDSYESAGLIMEFIGGEPFLAIDLIDQIVDYFIRAMIERQHPWATRYMISICSNGLLYFDEKVQKFIRKHLHHLSFSISIDGNKRLHDACRVKPDGSGSYDIAMAGVRHFVDVLGGSMGSKMTLAPQNVMYTYEAVTSIIENGYDEINLNCVYEEGWTPEHALILYQELKKVADYLLEKDLDDSKVYLSIFVDSFFKPKQPDDVQNWCWGKGTPILTKDGYKPIEEIKIGDLVYTEDGTIHPVINTMSHFANNVVKITNSGTFELFCTDNHQLYAKPFDYEGNKHKKYYLDYGKYQVKDLKSKDLIRLFKLPEGNIDYDKDLAYLVGRYIGDGWGKSICCSFEESEELKEAFKKAKVSCNFAKNKTVDQYTVNIGNKAENNDEFLRLIAECGHLATGKHFPSEVFNWNKNSLKALVSGYLDADGYVTEDGRRKCSTVSYQLAQELIILLKSIGYLPTCYINKRAGKSNILGREVNIHDRYEIYFYENSDRTRYLIEEDNKIWSSHFKQTPAEPQEVYNITVDTNHSYIAGGYVSANCGGNGRMISIDWKGDIYPCIRYMESSLGDSQKPMIIGNVDRGIMKCPEECEFVRQLKEIDRKTQSTEECFNCPIAEGCSWCFEAGTKISTPNGLENIEDLKVGDLVHDMNGTPQKIIRATSHEANDLVVVRAAGFNDIVVTEEHPFYAKQVIKRNHNIPTYGEPTWVSAKDLNVSDKIAMFIPKLGDKDIDKDLAYLVGRYIGDGWKTPSGREKTPFKYYICCNDQEQKELEDKLSSASISFSKNRNRTVNEYHLCTSSEKEKELMILLEECGRRSESKKIPREVWNWNKESVKALIEGYFAADGSIDKRHNIQRFCSINKNLIFEFAELIRAVYHKNVSITCRKGRKQKIEGRDVVAKDSFEGRFKIGEEKRKYYEYDEENNIIWANVATPKKIPPKNTKVYNIEVENNPTFIANGAIVHNCTAYNYQVFGTVNKRATYICIMHKARALANWYYWAKLYKKQGKAPYVHYIPDEMALEVISQEELDMLKSL